ncbi:MAG: DUF2807 domain-containing protein, partial [Catalinimonas sp.]
DRRRAGGGPGGTTADGPRKLFRDMNHNVLGGVAAGIGHYYNLDAFLVRIFFLLPPFLDWLILPGSITTITVIAYVILWIAVPGRADLQDDERVKRFYRDPDEKVLGGVASGTAAYFGTDVVVVRVLFLLSLFLGGFGFVLYLVLWAITPEAKTHTEKIRMRGEPVTLSNIEAQVRTSFQPRDQGEESVIVKILLFPFRLVALVVRSISASGILGFIGAALRVFAGLILLVVAFALIVATLAVGGTALGLISADMMVINGTPFPLDLFAGDFPMWALVPAALLLLLPGLLLGLAGLSLLVKRSLVSTVVSLTLFGLWVVSLVLVLIAVPPYVQQFRTEASVELVDTYALDSAAVLTLDLRETGSEWFDNDTRLYIEGYAGDGLRLEKRFSSRGSSRQDAIEQAGLIDYQVEQRDSTLVFGRTFELAPEAKFRDQELRLTLQVPYGQEFRMDRSLRAILRNSLTPAGYGSSQIDQGRWVFTEDGLRCLDCPRDDRTRRDRARATRQDRDASEQYERTFDYRDFSALDIEDAFRVYVSRGDDYRVIISSDDEDLLESLNLSQNDEQLNISLDRNGRWFDRLRDRDRLRVDIEMPGLDDFRLRGAVKADVVGFDTDDLTVDLSGASDARMDLRARRLQVKLDGASELRLAGHGERFEAELSGASELRAYDYRAQDVDLEASGASEAQVHALESIRVDAGGASSVRYQGQPARTDIRDGGGSSVRAD